MTPLVQWYKSIKAEAQCVTCQRWEHSVNPDKIEFHHIKAETKDDCLSNMVYRHRIIYGELPKPGKVMVEFMKCAPMCIIDHRQLHEAEHAGNTQLLADRFSLVDDEEYQKLNGQFWQMVIGKAPIEIRSEINDNLMDMLETGEIVFGERGFQLKQQPVRMQCH